MVKKCVIELNNDMCSLETSCDTNSLLTTNSDLQNMLLGYKNKITDYYHNKSWDKYKKISNEYETIFTTPNTSHNMSHYTPVSRSFFKLWEILHDFNQELNLNSSGIKVCLLCEGPGGFAEALIKYRNNVNDKYYGISLKSNNDRNIPEWKVPKSANVMNICYGADNTGNLYKMANITYLVNYVGKQSVDLITADGGFDFSSDFNHQEEMSMQLIYCEILAALLMQKDGGSFILKIYDMFTENSLKIIQVLKFFYEKIYIVKPLSSRPANSEKYLVCVGFKRREESKKYFKILFELVTKSSGHIDIPFDNRILQHIVSYNTYYTIRQIFHIQKTIDYINIFHNSVTSSSNISPNKNLLNAILEENRKKSYKWCMKYNI